MDEGTLNEGELTEQERKVEAAKREADEQRARLKAFYDTCTVDDDECLS